MRKIKGIYITPASINNTFSLISRDSMHKLFYVTDIDNTAKKQNNVTSFLDSQLTEKKLVFFMLATLFPVWLMVG